MSKKSHRQKEKRCQDRYAPNILSMQKQIMREAFLDYFGVAVALVVMALVVCMVGFLTEDVSHSKRIIFCATPAILCIAIIFIILFLRCFSVFSKLNKIQCSSEQIVEIVCKKVNFLIYARSKYSTVIICVILTDEQGKRFYFVTKDIPYDTKKRLRQTFQNARITLICYAKTNCVKMYQVHEPATKEQT